MSGRCQANVRQMSGKCQADVRHMSGQCQSSLQSNLLVLLNKEGIEKMNKEKTKRNKSKTEYYEQKVSRKVEACFKKFNFNA